MRLRLAGSLTGWPFISSIAVLLANDLWLKQAFPGLVTGKLSDFAGIAVVAILLMSLMPRRGFAISLAVAAGFAFWKSPWSQPFIELTNLYLPYSIGRVVDYTDLIALIVLPPCAWATSKTASPRAMPPWKRRVLVAPIAAATLVGLMGTSMVPTVRELQVRQRNPAAQLNHTVVAASVAAVATDLGMACVDCIATYSQAHYAVEGLSLSYSFPDGGTVVFVVHAFADGLYFGKTGPEKADRLIQALTKKMSLAYGDLEFVDRPGLR